MSRIYYSEKLFLLSYFVSLIVMGSLLLFLPVSWQGGARLGYIDALFTSASAVCVTGLITVDTSLYSLTGQVIILLLIQAGGLGIISFTTIYLARPTGKISLLRRGVVKGFYLDAMEWEPLSIIKRIIMMTFIIEGIGVLPLFIIFSAEIKDGPLFYALFHSISAFCNAGFSLFSNSLENYTGNAGVIITISALIVLGGLGFVVLQDVGRNITGKKRGLLLHTKIVLFMSASLLIISTALYFIFEHNHALNNLSPVEKVLAAIFQAVTTRTAGFNSVAQDSLSLPSRTLTLPLMFIGGASGSIAGGIKITTVFVVLLMVLQGPDSRGEVTVFKRKITAPTIFRSVMFMTKAAMILFLCIFLLTITERYLSSTADVSFAELFFESFSAFGTVGLSLGITSMLSVPGKIVIILTMFSGRVGLMLLAIPAVKGYPAHMLDYPKGEVLIG